MNAVKVFSRREARIVELLYLTACTVPDRVYRRALFLILLPCASAKANDAFVRLNIVFSGAARGTACLGETCLGEDG